MVGIVPLTHGFKAGCNLFRATLREVKRRGCVNLRVLGKATVPTVSVLVLLSLVVHCSG